MGRLYSKNIVSYSLRGYTSAEAGVGEGCSLIRELKGTG